jgi:uncharacterized protein (TIGR02118 family)
MSNRTDANRARNPLQALSRRDLLKGTGSALTWAALGSAFGATLPGRARAADSAVGSDCMTILYPAGEGLKFDADYYRAHHLPLITKLYGTSIERFELRPVAAVSGAPPSPFAAAVNIWIADRKAFDANNEKHGKTLVDDVPNFTNAQPTIQFDKVHGMAGAARSAMQVGDTCLTILYPNGENVRWDVDKYRTGHMPLIMKLYGEKAIKRFELRKGSNDMAGGAPKYIGTVNIYLGDQNAFQAAQAQHGETLRKDVPNFSSVMPTAFASVIRGVS